MPPGQKDAGGAVGISINEHELAAAVFLVLVPGAMLPDGQPHSCLVWVDHDGTCARVNTTLQRRSGRNLLADPRVSLLLVDRTDTARFLQVRGRAELVSQGALEHLDELTRRYTRHRCYYGHVYPGEQAAREDRVIVRIHARRVTLDAIHV